MPKGFISEMPVSLEELPGSGPFLVIHSAEATVRSAKDRPDEGEPRAVNEATAGENAPWPQGYADHRTPFIDDNEGGPGA